MGSERGESEKEKKTKKKQQNKQTGAACFANERWMKERIRREILDGNASFELHVRIYKGDIYSSSVVLWCEMVRIK
jgi:hypothetical protein